MSDIEPLDPQLHAALRQIADEAVVPPIDPAREQALMAAFDEHRARPRRRRRLHAPIAVGLLALAATMLFAVRRAERPSSPHPALAARNPIAQSAPATLARAPESARLYLPDPAFALSASAGKPPDRSDRAAFVMWPGAGSLPRFESGQLMRVELPASVVLSLGLRPSRPLRNDGTVQTDVLVGQDGYARAVRLVQ